MAKCTECGSEHIILKGKRNGKQRYKCCDCGKWFNVIISEKNEPDYEKTDNPIIKQLLDRYTSDELRIIANGKSINPKQQNRPIVDFDGDEIVIGFATDLHIGSVSFDDFLWESFLKECEKQKVSKILLAGDIIEGMSNRPDQIYQLSDIGFSAQMEHAQRLLVKSPFEIYTIDGNHDRWGIKSGGLFAVKEIAKQVPQMTFLGHDCADVMINGTKWELWHGEDGNSYATSYRVQKILEAMSGGTKPNVILLGHTHKQIYMFERNVHAVSGGALSYQSDWMRAKRIACHTGFHIIRATIANNQIVSFTTTWYPFYS